METISEKIFCAFCRLDRRVYTKKSITWTNVLMSALATVLVMFVFWQRAEPKAIMIFVLFISAAEVFVRLRWRLGMPCAHCGFDPVVYKRDRAEAARRVKAHLEKLKASGQYLLKSRNPLAQLPVQKKPPSSHDKKRTPRHPSRPNEGRLLSKSI